ncbi:AAA family ATPase [Arcobacter sp. YIC-464]|uniref:AAA family ATPase n=1 Tax=Arcobacter sp. YIC-464 TaxID=3376631 RepID=UPI003C1640F0
MSLEQVAQELKNSQKKVQLIYAFNGTGKTRLSRKFRLLVDPKSTEEEQENSQLKVMYYNAFTEDLFYWDNDLDTDTNRKLIIRPNNFTNLALQFLRDQGLDNNIVTNFQNFTSDFITPFFNEQYSEVTFSITRGDDQSLTNVKISKAEESNFIWCVYYSLLEEVIEILNETDLSNRSTDIFNQLEYVFIDDPVSSLDDNHLIELAVNISKLVKNSKSNLKFIITTHNPLFYNVISNELNNNVPNELYIQGEANTGIERWIYHFDKSIKYRFNKHSDGNFSLTELGRRTPFSYHLQLFSEIKKAISDDQIKKYHFSFMRNILEKTATFLGHSKWENLLPVIDGVMDPFANRILNLSSHSAHAGDEISEVQENDKTKLIELINFLETEYKFLNQSGSNDTTN